MFSLNLLKMFPLAVLLAFLPAGTLSAADYYVATTGNDQNPGSLNQPFRTIARGLNSARQPGDNVIVRKGMYPQSRTLNLANPGAADNYITLKAYRDEEVIIDGSNLPENATLIAVLAHHIRIQGFTVRNSQNIGISIWGPGTRVHAVEVTGNRVHHCQNSGIYAGFNRLSDPVRDLLIADNIISECSLMNEGGRFSQWSFGAGAGLSRNVTLRNNSVSLCYGEGIGLYLSNKGTIEGNTVHDNYSVNIYLDNTTNTRVSRNLVYSTGDKRFYRFNQPASGIQIANENYPGFNNPSSDNTIVGNILVNNFHAIYSGSYQRGGGLKRTLIAHNTACGSTGSLLHIDADGGHDRSRFVNNIFLQTGRAPLTDVKGTNDQIEFDHNLWFGGTPQQVVLGTGDIRANPQWKKTGGYEIEDYDLLPLSPAKNRGIRLNELSSFYPDQSAYSTVNLGAR
ncbi:right-handed parallel beta-helix repeat-containing protein [Gimesia sp.]|uniref:right-handed parallel beta-helix repeat-containing protein n=1 Tax=Gimesia sp. TaxID=2024833 RepID=UPI003A8D55F2